MKMARRSERPRLCCAALLRNLLWGGDGLAAARTHGALLMEPDEYFIRRVLQTGVRFVKLPGSLRG